jgi:UDP-galactopyranose mutase
VAELGDRSIGEPANFEEQALKFLGQELYEAFFRGYTIKQLGCDPTELPASILQRLPVRFDYNDSYYNSRWQGMPRDGYTAVIARILEHPEIEVKLECPWDPAMKDEFSRVVFTGPLDAYFGFREGRLGYRTVFWKRDEAAGDFQGNAVINYPDLADPHTRVHEYKHFAPWESHERTCVFTEFSKETGTDDIPYYPKRLASDREVLARYEVLAGQEEGVHFLGRLATYRYLDMHQVIGEALDFSRELLGTIKSPALP